MIYVLLFIFLKKELEKWKSILLFQQINSVEAWIIN